MFDPERTTELNKKQAALVDLEYVLTTPLRWAIKLWRMIVATIVVTIFLAIAVTLCAGEFVYRDGFWLFNAGPRSASYHEEHIALPEMAVDNVVTTDFYGELQPVFWDGSQYAPVPDGISFYRFTGATPCNATPLSATALGSWKDRVSNVYDRKSARIYLAYSQATFITHWMRDFFILEKHPVNFDPSPDSPKPTPDYKDSCTGNPTEEGEKLVVPHMPEVVVASIGARYDKQSDEQRLWYGLEEGQQFLTIRDGLSQSDDQMMTGICLKSECGESDMKMYFDNDRDQSDPVPPLSPHQEHALDALTVLSTEAFWLRAAHANGIHDDRGVRNRLNQILNDKPWVEPETQPDPQENTD